MVISFSDGVKISRFGNSARKALRERQDPTSESSTRIAETSNPSMSTTPMTSEGSTPNSIRDGVLRGGTKQEKEAMKCPRKSGI